MSIYLSMEFIQRPFKVTTRKRSQPKPGQKGTITTTTNRIVIVIVNSRFLERPHYYYYYYSNYYSHFHYYYYHDHVRSQKVFWGWAGGLDLVGGLGLGVYIDFRGVFVHFQAFEQEQIHIGLLSNFLLRTALSS